MLPLALALLLAQSPARGPLGVVVTSKRAGAEAFSPKVAQRVHAALERETGQAVLDDLRTAKQLKAAGYSDARKCQGVESCLGQLALILGPDAVLVSVDVGKLGSTLAIHLEAIAADASVLVTSDVTTTTTGWSDDTVAPFTVFARALKDKLVRPAPAPAPPVAAAPQDAPRAEPLAPPPPAAPVEPAPAVAAASVAPSRAPAIGAGIGAGLGLVSAVTFGVLGLSSRSAWQASKMTVDGMTVSTLTEAEATGLASRGNTYFTVALVSGVVTLALAAVCAVLLAL